MTTTDGERRPHPQESQKYLGIPYPNFSGNPDETRVLITIEVDSVVETAR